MLIYIAVFNLLPTAFRYEQQQSQAEGSPSRNKNLVMTYFISGMLLIAIALVVLDSTGNHSHDVNTAGLSSTEDDHHHRF